VTGPGAEPLLRGNGGGRWLVPIAPLEVAGGHRDYRRKIRRSTRSSRKSTGDPWREHPGRRRLRSPRVLTGAMMTE
jgi:hypothetical protein